MTVSDSNMVLMFRIRVSAFSGRTNPFYEASVPLFCDLAMYPRGLSLSIRTRWLLAESQVLRRGGLTLRANLSPLTDL